LKTRKPSLKAPTPAVQQPPLPPQAPLPEQTIPPPQPAQPKAFKAPVKGLVIREPSFPTKKPVLTHQYSDIGKGKAPLVEKSDSDDDLPFEF
jgi:hypothetical protein